jgi:hypothetical protein
VLISSTGSPDPVTSYSRSIPMSFAFSMIILQSKKDNCVDACAGARHCLLWPTFRQVQLSGVTKRVTVGTSWVTMTAIKKYFQKADG